MSWNEIKKNIEANKATEAQIKYAEKLLESLYGDINKPIYTMSKMELSVLIDECKTKLEQLGGDSSPPIAERQETNDSPLSGLLHAIESINPNNFTAESLRNAIDTISPNQHPITSAVAAVQEEMYTTRRRISERELRAVSNALSESHNMVECIIPSYEERVRRIVDCNLDESRRVLIGANTIGSYNSENLFNTLRTIYPYIIIDTEHDRDSIIITAYSTIDGYRACASITRYALLDSRNPGEVFVRAVQHLSQAVREHELLIRR